MNNKVRVLMLVDSLNYGGTETHVLGLIKELKDQDIYIILGTNGGPLTKLVEEYGIRVIHIPFKLNYMCNNRLVSIAKSLKPLLNKERINLIHCHLHGSMELGREINLMYKIPYIITLHGLFYNKQLLKSTCKNSKAIIAVSEPVKTMLANALDKGIMEKVSIIPNGVNISPKRSKFVRQSLNISLDHLLITYCSRLGYKKTIVAKVFLESCYSIGLKYNNVHFLLIGDGIDSEEVEQEINSINTKLEKKLITKIGMQKSIIDYLMDSDLIIGTGRVALEAMSCAKPVFAIGSEGIVGLVSSESRDLQWDMYFGDHAGLYDLNSKLLSRELYDLIEDKSKLNKIGLWGRQWCIDMFDERKVVKKTIELYKESIKDKLKVI